MVGSEIETIPTVPYEITANDEKFLQEASKLIDVNFSELDICHHRVVLKLRKSCHELNAEQLGKLSVMLLNCQSNSEGRMLFDCTDQMSLKECTKGMDSDTWNAYHLITNRAKAVCMATRHEQFRGLTEITVNKLMASAHHQISMMNQLADNQNKLRDITTNAMDEFTDQSGKLLTQQKEILQVADAHRSVVESNLHELMREKGLIRSGQLEVARMIDQLKEKLDQSLVHLKQQSKESKHHHAALTKELDELQTHAFRISDKLRDTTEYILSQNEIASTQFEQTLRQLSDINETISKLSTLLRTLENSVEHKLAWISDKVGGTDALLAKINLVLQHFGYLLLGMLLLVFVNASAFYRIFFIMAVPLNFFCTIINVHHVDLIQLSEIIVAVFAGNAIRICLSSVHLRNPFALGEGESTKKLTKKKTKATDLSESETERVSSYDRHDVVLNESNVLDNNNDYSLNSYVSAFKSRHREGNFPIDNRERSMTPSTADNRSNHSRSMTPFTTLLNDRIRCTSLTMKGDQCRNAAIIDRLYCRTHEK